MNYAKGKAPIGERLADIFIWLFLILACVFVVTPLLFMVTASFMPAIDIMKLPYPWFSDHIHWQNYWNGLKGPDGSFIFVRNILNSLVVALSVTATTVLLSSMSGYGLAKFQFKGRNLVFMLIMATMMIPFETIMIPLYMVVTKMGLHDSYAGLILPFLTNAFGVFLMRQFLITFPDEVLDAARIDGASEPRIFANIVLPNSGPAIATLAILTFRSQWDNLLWPLLVVQSDEMKTIPLYITKFMAETHSDEGIMMAVATMASLPMFILFFTMSNYFISTEGLHSTVKG
ncbi:MAG: carbohydrate ABC transporter permease [Bacillota bacterium]|jgi:multiple sugar transport system permease protein|nr:carbohydrate ABC transporter permease [Bacillota bacterium]HOB42469.1 carbohydrate ABC transporter permease [Bacillota bacterium]HOL51152.1 carbohydrate ABC transporter permease [Bacillota bacterium]HOO31193.1 carbohydrate ABC transporter permease [Bacillota bacterium]HPQ01759.1 carbohydrate ABC transporter permease [Bacillota bacterium]